LVLFDQNLVERVSGGNMVEVVNRFEQELNEMESLMRDEISFKSYRLEDLVNIQMNCLDQYLCPSMVFAVGRVTGQSCPKMIHVAAVFQYVFLAHHIHAQVTDQDLTESQRQYPVLVGDFMLGQTFIKLCDNDLFPYSAEFVKLIKTINEGVVLRWRLNNKSITLKDYRTIMEKKRGSIMALAAKLAAEILDIQQPYVNKLEEFGYYMGMGWAAWEEPFHASQVQEYLMKAKGIIGELRDQLQVKPLQELYDFFNQQINKHTVLAGIQ